MLTPLGRESERANDLWFLSFDFFFYAAEATLSTQCDNEVGKLLVGCARAKLSVERVSRNLLQRVSIDFVNCLR